MPSTKRKKTPIKKPVKKPVEKVQPVAEKPMTHAALAKLIGVGSRQMTNIKLMAGYPKDGTPEEVKKWYDARKKKTKAKVKETADLTADYHQERALLTQANRRIAELDLEIKKANLVPMADARAAIFETLGTLRARLDALPSRLCNALNAADPALAQEVLREALNDIYEQLQKNE